MNDYHIKRFFVAYCLFYERKTIDLKDLPGILLKFSKYCETNPSLIKQDSEKVFTAVYKVTGVTKSQITSSSRRPDVAFARHAVCYFLKEIYGMAGDVIAGFVNRDRTTVIHSLGVIRDMIEYKEFHTRSYKIISQIEKEIESYE